MAAKKGGESKTGLVVTIVFLVVLVIALGVTSYYGFAYQADLQTAAKAAQDKEKSITKSRDWEKFKALQYKAYIGLANADDMVALSDARAKYDANTLGDKEDDKKTVDEAIKKMDDKDSGTGWDPDKKQPTTPLLNQITTLSKRVKTLEDTQAKIEKDHATALEDLNTLQTTNKAKIDTLITELAAAKKDASGAIAKHSTEFDEAMKTITDREAEIVKLKNEGAAAKTDFDKQLVKLTKENTEYKRTVDKLKAATEVKVDFVKTDTPKGKIVNLSRSGTFAYIDLGSADNVRPQLSFSVFGVGPDGKALAERKAAVEIVNITEAHMSLVKLADVVDPYRNPVMVGDLLFNPAWSPTLKQHVAIAGLIDLTGDGKDSTQEFVRNLEKQGIIVDAYLDLKDVSIKGKGLNLQTNFLVLGELPEFDTAVPLKEGSPAVERKKDIIARMSEMQAEAARLGTTVIPARRFMALVGYHVPRTSSPADFTVPRGTAVKETPKEPAKETPAPEAPK